MKTQEEQSCQEQYLPYQIFKINKTHLIQKILTLRHIVQIDICSFHPFNRF